jgi:hypothetical protein
LPRKKELFLACDERACETVLETFRRAASGAPPGEKLAAMGRAYSEELLPDRHAVLMMMQGFAAAGADPDIRACVRQTFRDMAMEVAELGRVAAGDVWAFFANEMLLDIVTALELEDMAVLAHAHPVSACREQHGAQKAGRRAELDEDVLSRV